MLLTGVVPPVFPLLPELLSVVPNVTVARPTLPATANTNTSATVLVLFRNGFLSHAPRVVRTSSTATRRQP